MKLGNSKGGRLWYLRKCANSAKYKGIYPPKCGEGKGCDACRAKYAAVSEERKREGLKEDALSVARARAEAKAYERQRQKELNTLLNDNIRLRKSIEAAAAINKGHEIITYRMAKTNRVDAVACGVASDWHVEERVDAASVHGLNEYAPEIARARAEMFAQNLLRLTDMAARDSRITTIYLPVLGDLYTGYLHEENLAANSMGPATAANFAKALLDGVIQFILKESSYHILSDMIPGNHGRLTKKMWAFDPAGTSMEALMYYTLAEKYENNKRVQLVPAGRAMVYRQFFERFMVRLIHGYEINYGGGVGGITIPVNKAIASWDAAIKAALTVFGHFHQDIDGGHFIGNGSLIGYNAYAQKIKARMEPPVQKFFLIHARHGGEKALTAPIWVTK